MIPSALITHLEEGMEDFLRASFWSSTPAFEGLLERFLEERESLFKAMQYLSSKKHFQRWKWYQPTPQKAFFRLVLT